MNETSEKHVPAATPEQPDVTADKAPAPREGASLQIKEFDQATRKRVRDRVY